MNGGERAFIFVGSGVWGGRVGFGGRGRANRGFEMFYLKRRDLEEFSCVMYFMACAQGTDGAVKSSLD